jgi:hypothetical protein
VDASCAHSCRYPTVGCRYCVSYSEGGAQDVQCLDGHRFCFACKTSAHRPASCSEADKWMVREKDEGENAKWLLANTKPCPQCRKSIEKNQGCNHMTCRPEVGGCKFQFCWVRSSQMYVRELLHICSTMLAGMFARLEDPQRFLQLQ